MILELSSILQPKHLNKEYKTNLLINYKNDYENNSNDCGFIVKINNIENVITSFLNNSNEIIIKSKCDCIVFKPIVGMELDCKIDLIHINGLFLNKYGIKIMVPSSGDYIYKQDHIVLNNVKYKVNDNISISIVNVRFYKNIYSCIGKLILKKK
jgi:hypothetical protein